MNSPRDKKLSTDFFDRSVARCKTKEKRDAMFDPASDQSGCFPRVPDKLLSAIAARLFTSPSSSACKSIRSLTILELSTGVDNFVRNFRPDFPDLSMG
jgi:hypothetical protein